MLNKPFFNIIITNALNRFVPCSYEHFFFLISTSDIDSTESNPLTVR